MAQGRIRRLVTGRQVNWVGTALVLLIVVGYVVFNLDAVLVIALAVLVLSAVAGALRAVVGTLRGRLEHTPGTCLNCDYDLTGLDDGAVCPECGESLANER